MGAIRPGVLDLYADVPTVLGTEELADALAFADLATLILLDARIDETGAPVDGALADRGFEYLGGYRAEIDQATGILTVQLEVGIDEAFVRLRAYAYTQGRRLPDVAADVVAHRLRFSPDAEPRRTDDEA
jgi:hypothetical protein